MVNPIVLLLRTLEMIVDINNYPVGTSIAPFPTPRIFLFVSMLVISSDTPYLVDTWHLIFIRDMHSHIHDRCGKFSLL